MPALNHSEEVLCKEILAEAHRQSDQIICDAQEHAETVLEEAATAGENARQARLDAARREASRQKGLITAVVPVEAGRLRSEQTERVLQTIYEAARQQLNTRTGFDYPKAMIALVTQAIERMAGNEFVIRISAGDRQLFEEAFAENAALNLLHSSPTLKISEDPKIKERGFIIEDPKGHQVWDNRLPIRLERLWPELRREVALQAGLIFSAAGGSK